MSQISHNCDKYKEIQLDTVDDVERWIICRLAHQYEDLDYLIQVTGFVCRQNKLPYDCTRNIMEKVVNHFKKEHFFSGKFSINLFFEEKTSRTHCFE